MSISNVILLLGGVALFLFGMGLMGDSLKKVAGNKLEPILYKLSGTTLKGLLLGTGVTAIIQSSCATSVMVVGFVNSGMMKLKQAISVILGAIIGTSVTGWIICLSELGTSSLDLSFLSTESISAVVAILGIVLKMTSKKKSLKNVGDILMGFAVLMFGMKTMSSAVSVLKDSAEFIGFLTNFKNPLIGVLIGALFTAILQSASAAVGILQALSVTGAIDYEIAIPIIMGIAIGASMPVLLSGAGSTTEGKRTSLSYLVIEIIRVILFAIAFFGCNAIFKFSFLKNTMNMVSIALLNTVFRASTCILLTPFISLIEKLLCHIIKANPKDEKEMEAMDKLEERFLAYPALAIEQSGIVIKVMSNLTQKNIFDSIKLLSAFSEKGYKEVEALENIIDKYEDKIGRYLSKIAARELGDRDNQFLTMYLHAITDLERISDHAMNIADLAQEIHEEKVEFSGEAKKELDTMIAAITEVMNKTIDCFEKVNVNEAFLIEPLEEVIDLLCKEMRANHIERLSKQECTINNGYVFNDLIVNFERISDHCSNIGLLVEETKDDIAAHELEDLIKLNHSNDFDKNYEYFSKKYKI